MRTLWLNKELNIFQRFYFSLRFYFSVIQHMLYDCSSQLQLHSSNIVRNRFQLQKHTRLEYVCIPYSMANHQYASLFETNYARCATTSNFNYSKQSYNMYDVSNSYSQTHFIYYSFLFRKITSFLIYRIVFNIWSGLLNVYQGMSMPMSFVTQINLFCKIIKNDYYHKCNQFLRNFEVGSSLTIA